MSGSKGDPVADAALRLEAAMDRLSRAALRARQTLDTANGGAAAQPGAGGIPPASVLALADRLDSTLARLREILGENEEA